MATLTVVPAARAGVEVVLAGTACAAGGDAFANDGQAVAVITNSSVSGITVTIATPNTLDGQAITDRTVTVAAGATTVIGPFPSGVYNDSNGLVQLTYSDVTTCYIKVIKVAAA